MNKHFKKKMIEYLELDNESELKDFTNNELLEAFLNYNGFIGCDDMIISAIENIYGITLEN